MTEQQEKAMTNHFVNENEKLLHINWVRKPRLPWAVFATQCLYMCLSICWHFFQKVLNQSSRHWWNRSTDPGMRQNEAILETSPLERGVSVRVGNFGRTETQKIFQTATRAKVRDTNSKSYLSSPAAPFDLEWPRKSKTLILKH